jgi:hypothetical protein
MTRQEWEKRQAEKARARDIARLYQMAGWRVSVETKQGRPVVRAVKQARPRAVALA